MADSDFVAPRRDPDSAAVVHTRRARAKKGWWLARGAKLESIAHTNARCKQDESLMGKALYLLSARVLRYNDNAGQLSWAGLSRSYRTKGAAHKATTLLCSTFGCVRPAASRARHPLLRQSSRAGAMCATCRRVTFRSGAGKKAQGTVFYEADWWKFAAELSGARDVPALVKVAKDAGMPDLVFVLEILSTAKNTKPRAIVVGSGGEKMVLVRLDHRIKPAEWLLPADVRLVLLIRTDHPCCREVKSYYIDNADPASPCPRIRILGDAPAADRLYCPGEDCAWESNPGDSEERQLADLDDHAGTHEDYFGPQDEGEWGADRHDAAADEGSCDAARPPWLVP